MSSDPTEQQGQDGIVHARQLSMRRSQPPGEAPGYELIRFLGSGAYGEVWEGRDRNTGRCVAVKFYLHRGGLDWSLLTREVEKLVFLSADRYVVQLLDVGWYAEPPYYVMEYVERGSLEDWIAEQGALPAEQAVEVFRDVAVGLTHAHDKGVLHCDLKPANVLLDQDRRPRLADFGQSRLSTEQTPALGTLFYMAPEQADMSALPDARWDVYALGALLYCMLTGSPPHRSERLIAEIESAGTLTARLLAYRRAIAAAMLPDGHRFVPGVDRALAEIVDQCLAVQPRKRFANAQVVLDALRSRELARSRRPLFVLGLLGPILLLAIMALFWWGAFNRAVHRSEATIKERTYESNEFAAKYVAKSFEAELAGHFRAIEQETRSPQLLEALRPVLESPLLVRLNDPQLGIDDRRQLRDQFLADGTRGTLRDYLERRLADFNQSSPDNGSRLASIFVTDDWGTIVAAAYAVEVLTRSPGTNYSWRTYFHGGPEDLPPGIPATPPPHVESTVLSAAFKSSSTETWKIAISTPIRESRDASETLLGVMAFTFDIGDFGVFRPNKQGLESMAVLIDDRQGDHKGTLLQHPLFRTQPPADDCRVTADVLARIRREPVFDYQDPAAASPGGEVYLGDWIAAAEPVELPARSPGSLDRDPRSHLLVLVQVNAASTTAPVRDLRRSLTRDAAVAMAVVVLTVIALWSFVWQISGTRWRPGARRGDRGTGSSASPSADAPGQQAG